MITFNVKAVITAIALAVVIFFAGRYSVDTSPESSTVEEINKTKDTKKETTIVERPDGSKETHIVEETRTDTNKSRESVSKPVDYKNKFNISLLASYDFKEFKPIYGISANKEVLGPLTLGVFGLTNGTVGLSVGMNFQ